MAAAAVAAAAASFACSDGEESSVQRGERVYRQNCTTCHAQDPSVDGTVGPALAGTPREVVESRVLRAEYPPGYTPKRPSRVMPPMPYLTPEIPFLADYLASVKKP